MATAAATNTFITATPALAAEVNTNFTDLVTFLNNSTVHRDGSKSMTANFDAGSNKIVNLTAGVASTDGANMANVNAALPVGMISLYGGAAAPSLWALCDGTEVSRVTYSALFAVIGTAFGAGDGATTFNLPDFRDKYAIGDSGTLTLGGSVGSNNAVAVAHTHTSADHSHTTADHSHSFTTGGRSAAHTHSGTVNRSILTSDTANPAGTMSSPSYPGVQSEAGVTITTGTESADHTHSGTTGGASNGNTTGGASDGNTTNSQSPTSTGTNANRPSSVVVNYIIRTGV